MTRKDFELIARTIRNAKIDDSARWEVSQSLAHSLKGTNERFDASRFIAAAVGK